LDDAPAESDAFGSHDRAASVIADLVAHEKGGKSIALTGAWGSGKSSAVKQLRAKLSGIAEVLVLDAWAHQGDPLRRVLLENLIDFFLDKHWVHNPTAWTRTKQELSQRFQEAHTTSTPILTAWGFLLAISGGVLFPLGIALLAKFDLLERGLPHVLGLLGLILMPTPLLVLLVAYLWWRPWRGPKRITSPEFWVKHAEPHEKDSLLALFLNKTRETKETQTIQTPNPTSVEFQSTFRDLLREGLEDEHRKLLLVVDNLDRVDPADALQIWATMRTFFDFDRQSEGTSLERLWLLVPFDPSALRRLWSDSSANHKGDDDLVRAFVDKTFQATFHVPPPVLSDWHQYLRSQLAAALPDHTEEDFHAVYRIYDLRGVSAEHPPTPREIKLFVNRLGAIHRRWVDEISLPLQALYVVLADGDWRAQAELQKEEQELLKPVPVQLVGPQWRDALAAIYFGCETEKALQFLWGHRVNTALTAGDVSSLQSLGKIRGFTQVCEQVIEEKAPRWAQEETKTIGIAANTLSQLDVTEDRSWERVWTLLRDNASAVSSWKEINRHVGAGMACLVQRDPTTEFVRAIVNALSASSPSQEAGEARDAAGVSEWVEGVAAVLRVVHTQSPDLVQGFRVAGDVRGWLGVASALATHNELRDLRTLFRPAVAPADVVAELVTRASDGRFDERSADAVTTMLLLAETWEWQPLVSQFRARLEGQNATPQEIGPHISTLLRLAPSAADARKTLKLFAQNGHAFHYLHAVSGAGQHRSAALCLATVIAEIPAGAALQMPGNAAPGQTLYQEIMQKPDPAHRDVVQEFSDLTVDFDLVESLWEIPGAAPIAAAFIRAVFEAIARRNDAHEIITPKRITARCGFLNDFLQRETLKALISKSVQRASLVSQLISNAFDRNLGTLYLDVLCILEDSSNYVEFLRRGLRELPQDVWQAELQKEGHLVELVLELTDKEHSPSLTASFQDALLAHAQLLIAGRAKVDTLQSRWGTIPSALTDSARATFFRRMIDEVCSSSNSTDGLLEIYGTAIAESDAVERKADDLVLKGFSNFFRRRSVPELQWTVTVFRGHPTLLDRVDPSTRSDFEDRVRGTLSEKNLATEVRAAVAAIARAAVIDRPASDGQAQAEGAGGNREPT